MTWQLQAALPVTFFPSNIKAFPEGRPSVSCLFLLFIYSVSSPSSTPSSLLFLLHIFGCRLSVSLGTFVPPGVNQLPDKQLLDEGDPRVSGVTAVGGGAVGLNHSAAL